MIKFTIPGPPKGKGRPKFFRRGNFVGTYTPKETASYENLVKLSFRQAHCGNPMEGAIRIEIYAYFPIPKSTAKRVRLEMSTDDYPVTKKPDIDNIEKSILDGLNGVAFRDDSQVSRIVCAKIYSENPRTVVKIEEDIPIKF